MKTVQHILATKGDAVHWIPARTSVFDALQRMADHGIGSLLVKDHERPIGLFTERDFARKVIDMGRSARETPVREIMDERVLVVRPEQDIEACMAIMTDQRVRHLLVMNDGEVLGIVSIGDLVKAIIEDQRFTIEQLVRYISGEA